MALAAGSDDRRLYSQASESTAEEVLFEWSHHRILLTDLKVRSRPHVFITDSGSERGFTVPCSFDFCRVAEQRSFHRIIFSWDSTSDMGR